MVSSINTGIANFAGFIGNAPASPQSARGESATDGRPRSEEVAVSQANSPLFDQKVQTQDLNVAARAATTELAARLDQLPREQDTAPQAQNGSQSQLVADPSLERTRVQQSEDTSENKNFKRNDARRAREAYQAQTHEAPESRMQLAV
ncbi:MAG: hypothetical protein KKB70_12000 [Proteobacteria bacterium]|nr:hypothetical protein [Pseudomonadota bacterium]MBU1612246.1 hypothetical protein [Pseudomonadota bacterium]